MHSSHIYSIFLFDVHPLNNEIIIEAIWLYKIQWYEGCLKNSVPNKENVLILTASMKLLFFSRSSILSRNNVKIEHIRWPREGA